ncbi:MBL fold metallo-hydrolase [Arenibacterium halophilum]|uniref:MBL fold metallo-hydrolase n=1 Tax=Arenibacterium halophilum TaxID=2583821 RepID=A0ABY2WYJ1_9RHOB|nr:MBL fold metallo-hydrolase [Arenibacterium halophilum]TMV07379.1 MBL fold metallo-hydrolase [Arenibacterium halophilum]
MPSKQHYLSSSAEGGPNVHCLYDVATGSWQYICADSATGKCAIIDPVLDFDPASARTSTTNADMLLKIVADKGYEVQWILDTHPHADHLSAGHCLATRTGAPHAIGQKVADIARLWRDYYNLSDAFPVEQDFGKLLKDGDSIMIGDLQVNVLLSAGHTLGSITYVAGDAAFVHDTLMHVDVGTARADFPGGSAGALWDSIQTILALPDHTRLFVGHDYGTDTRDEAACEATVSEHRASNPHVGEGKSRDEFVKLREDRDATLGLPDRMLYALQVNLRGGRLPPEEADGHAYFKIPANRF